MPGGHCLVLCSKGGDGKAVYIRWPMKQACSGLVKSPGQTLGRAGFMRVSGNK